MSTENDKFVPKEGLMVNARYSSCEKEFFRINPGVDMTSRFVDVVDRCKQLPFRLYLPVEWLNECLSKDDWKELRQRGQELPSVCETMVHIYQVSF